MFLLTRAPSGNGSTSTTDARNVDYFFGPNLITTADRLPGE
jgi:hypothetical protein